MRRRAKKISQKRVYSEAIKQAVERQTMKQYCTERVYFTLKNHSKHCYKSALAGNDIFEYSTASSFADVAG